MGNVAQKAIETATNVADEIGKEFNNDIELTQYFSSVRFWVTLIIIVVVVALMFFSNKLFKLYKGRILKKEKNERVVIQRNTTAHFISSIIKALIIIVAFIVILQVNGVNVTSLVAGLGILSAIVGLALQDVIKDIVTGLRIVSEHYFGVGDVIMYEDIEGEVIELSIRSTTIRNILNDEITTISNRLFAKATKLYGIENYNIPISYEEDRKKVDKVFEEIVDDINALESVESCEYRGIQDFEDSYITYRIWCKCRPVNRPAVHREVNGLVKKHLDEAGISIPFTQIDIHQK